MARIKRIKPEIQFFPKRLMENLDFVKHYQLTLVEAPSGFGKTTALRHFVDSRICDTAQVCWHTFSEEAPNTLWKAFCGLIGLIDSESARLLIDIGLPDEDNIQRIQGVFRGINCPEETYVVLDDFTSWKIQIPGEFLMALSEHGGKGLHVVVISQLLSAEAQNILLPNSRFFLLRESVLTFSREDIDAYYRKAGVPLTSMQLEELERATEGWVMALYLQLLYFIENSRFENSGMKNLIHKALWNWLPNQEKEFLLSISIFTRFSLAQATAMSGMSLIQTENLLREKRVFVHYDKEADQFYLHSLFQSFLREQFALLPELKQKTIYLAGGDLAGQAGDRVNTLRFYYLSGDWERLLSLPLTSYEIADIVDENTKPMILDIMDNTSFEIKRKYPSAIVPLAFTLFFLHENQKLLEIKEEINQVIIQSDLPQIQKDALSGEMELLLSFLEYNRIDAMSKRHRRALELLKGPATLINVKSTWTFGSPSVLYMFYRESGNLSEELEQMEQCMPVYYALTSGHGSGSEIIMRAEAHFMRGELEEAEILCHKAMFTADNKRQNSIYQCGLFLLGRIAILRGDQVMLQNALQSLEERSQQNTEDLCRYTLDLARGYLFLILGREDEISPWISEGAINDKRLVIMTQPFAHIIYGGILLKRGEYQKLIGVSQFGMGLSSIFPNLLSQIHIKLYMAQAFDALGRHAEAINYLRDALMIAIPDRIYMPFAENYVRIKGLLPYADCSIEAQDRILTLAKMLEKGLIKLGQKELPLSPREGEVYLMLQEGLTNPMIAKKMSVSISTVKATVSSILNKKGVSSREMLKKNRMGK